MSEHEMYPMEWEASNTETTSTSPLGIRLKINKNTQFHDFIDSEARIHDPEDIIFISQDGYDRLSNGDSIKENEIATKKLEEVNCIQDSIHEDDDLFPLQISIKNQLYPYKISSFKHELLPKHAGTVPFINSIFFGLPNAGKSIYTIQMTSRKFINMILRSIILDTGETSRFVIKRDIKMLREDEIQKQEKEDRFFDEKTVPMPSPKGVRISPSYFYIRYNHREALLKIEDVSGETCAEINYSSDTILKSDTFVVMISAKDLINEDESVVNMIQTLSETVNAYVQMEDAWVESCNFIIAITQADLLPNYQNIIPNSLGQDRLGRMAMQMHKAVLDMDLIMERSEQIKDIVRDYHIGLYQHLQFLEDQGHNVTFSLMASIGTKVGSDQKYSEYKPFNIDEPFLFILNRYGVYPSNKTGEAADNEDLVEIAQRKASLIKEWFSRQFAR